MSPNARRAAAVSSGIIGVIAFWMGVQMCFEMSNDNRRRSALQSAPRLASAQPGQAAYLEGKVGADNPALHGPLVCYVSEYYQTGKRSGWYELSRKTPPLTVQEADGTSRIANDDYEMMEPPEMTDGSEDHERRRSRGFVADSPIAALGKRGPDGGLVTEVVYPGSRERFVAYLADRRRRALNLVIWGLGLGSLLLAVCFWNARKLRGEPGMHSEGGYSRFRNP